MRKHIAVQVIVMHCVQSSRYKAEHILAVAPLEEVVSLHNGIAINGFRRYMILLLEFADSCD